MFEERTGYIDAMKMLDALDMFDKLYGKFPYEHVWYIVKDEPRWKEEYMWKRASTSASSKRTKVSESAAYTSSGGDLGATEVGEEIRPIGQKAAKRL